MAKCGSAQDGLPLRMTMNMKFPPTKTGERIEAHLSTDFFVQQPESQQAASLYLLGWLSGAGRKMAFNLMAWLNTSSTNSSDALVLVSCMGLVFCFAGLLLLTQRDLKNSYLYRLVACLVILCTLITPLWEGARAQEYSSYTQSESQKQSDREQQTTRQRETIDEFYGMDWNPQASPYAQVDSPVALGDRPIENTDILSPILSHTASSLADEPGGSETDADMDGLTDAFESQFEVTILNPNDSDTDDDGLNDGEELKLGLLPGEIDSDNDGILDIDEVQNWYGYDQYWWTDPNSKDTDKDGILDGVECPERVPPKPYDPTWSPGICRDTDQDKNPNVFDQDDDDDGVPSIVDASPSGYDTQVYSQANPFKMTVSNLETDDIFIDYQLKPTNPEHLTYSMNVLDWPSGDTDGQIMRISETTFMDQLAPEKRAGDSKADKGDLRLIPMLEIRLTDSTLPLQLTDMLTVPITSTSGSSVNFSGVFRLTSQSGSTQVMLVDAPAGSYPVYHGKGACDDIVDATYITDLAEGGSATVTGVSLGAFAQGDRVLYVTNAARSDVIACTVVTATAHGSLVDQVVDGTLLSSYGITARNDTDNSVLLYSPLSMVYDYAGGTPTAFQSRIPFTNTDGRMNGSHQEVRAVWLLDMMTDVCKPRPEGFTGDWCTASDPEHWYTDQSRIVQTYNEDFKLAGLNIQEDYGLDMAVIFEDPAIDPDPQYDDPLWGLSHGLEGSFVAGRDTDDDGVRDVKVSDLAGRFDASLNGCPAPDPGSSTYPYVYRQDNHSDWGLPCNAFKVLNYQYEYSDGVHEFMQTQAQQVFEDYFPSPGTTPSYVNLLFARETNNRTARLWR